MLVRLEIQEYRALRGVFIDLGAFCIVAGAVGSGKTTVLDCVSFLADLLGRGLGAARERCPFDVPRGTFSMVVAVELRLPGELWDSMIETGHDRVRYELVLDQAGFVSERVALGAGGVGPVVIDRSRDQVHFLGECGACAQVSQIPNDVSALQQMPCDERFAATTWARTWLTQAQVWPPAPSALALELHALSPPARRAWLDRAIQVVPHLTGVSAAARAGAGNGLVLDYQDRRVALVDEAPAIRAALALAALPWIAAQRAPGLYLVDAPERYVAHRALARMLASLRQVERQVLVGTGSPELVGAAGLDAYLLPPLY